VQECTPNAKILAAYDWDLKARDEQREPLGDWTVWLILAGRGFGKTRTGAEFTHKKMASGDYGRFALVGRTVADVRDVMIEGESGILACSPPWSRPKYEPSKRRLTWPNGAIATTYSADEPDLLRGPQHDGFWCLAGETPVLLADGSEKPIKNIRVGDYVMTRKGPRKVTGHCLTKQKAEVYQLQVMGGRSIIGTAEHPVWVQGSGFVPISQLSEGMSLLCATHVSNVAAISGISVPTETTTSGVYSSTASSGSKPTAQFQRGTISTTRTVIRPTTGWKTWNYSHTVNIVRGTTKRNYHLIEKKLCSILKRLWNAIDKCAYSRRLLARIVGRNILAPRLTLPGSVHHSALMPVGQVHLMVNCENVNIVQRNTLQQRERSDIVLENAIHVQANNDQVSLLSDQWYVTSVALHSSQSDQMPVSVQGNAPVLSTIVVDSVEKLAKRVDVYDIAIEDAHEFFAHGVLVHNCDELAAWLREDTWNQLQFGLRLGKKPRGIVTTTPRPTKLIIELSKSLTTHTTRGSTYDNRANLAPSFFAQIIKKYEGTRLGRQELLAEILMDIEGALWKQSRIDELRVRTAPELKRIVVAIDPAVTATEGSDETGIVVAGLGIDNHGYTLADRSLRGSPHEWASQAINAYIEFNADRIVAEVNNGGDMVEHVIRGVAKERGLQVAYKEVRATRGKQLRAEPVSALTEQGIAHHVGFHPELEDQKCTWVPGDAKSPDRLDAEVWAFTDLMIGPNLVGGMVMSIDNVLMDDDVENEEEDLSLWQ
jgi:phage terminase large subunit-like protein